MKNIFLSAASEKPALRAVAKFISRAAPFILILAVMVAAPGCSWFKGHKSGAQAVAKPAVTAPEPIVTPDLSQTAKVISFNTVARFVIVNFPGGQLPKQGQTLFLYRNGLKVAEIKISGPQENDNIVADLVSGDAQVGDTVSAQ